jgi:hypothetical protein
MTPNFLFKLTLLVFFALTGSNVLANQDIEPSCHLISINDLMGKDIPNYEMFSIKGKG